MTNFQHLRAQFDTLLSLYEVAPSDAARRALDRIPYVARHAGRTVGAFMVAVRPADPGVANIAVRVLGSVRRQGNLMQSAIDDGLIDDSGPAFDFYREVLRTHGASLVATGIDIRAAKASDPVKGWLFFDRPIGIDQLLALDTLPAAARRHLPLFAALGHRGTTVLAIDGAGSFNPYFFGVKPYLRDARTLHAALGHLGLAVPPSVVPALLQTSVTAYPTFPFDPGAEHASRMCIGTAITPRQLGRQIPTMTPFADFGERIGGPILSMNVGSTLGPTLDAFQLKVEFQPPQLGAFKLMLDTTRYLLTPAESLAMHARLLRRHPLAFPLLVLSQAPPASSAIRAVSRWARRAER